MRESGTTGSDRLVLLAVAYCHDDGIEAPTFALALAYAGMSESAFRRTVSSLVERGIIARSGGGGRGDVTKLWLERVATVAPSNVKGSNLTPFPHKGAQSDTLSSGNKEEEGAQIATLSVNGVPPPSSPLPSLSPRPPISTLPPIAPPDNAKSNGKKPEGERLARKRAPPSDAIAFPETFNVTKGMWTWTQNEGMTQEFVMQETKIWVADWRSTSAEDQLAQKRNGSGWMFAWQGHLLKHWKAEQRSRQRYHPSPSSHR